MQVNIDMVENLLADHPVDPKEPDGDKNLWIAKQILPGKWGGQADDYEKV